MLISMPFDGTPSGGKYYGAFRKVQKIGKGLKSNGTNNIAGFLYRNRFTRHGKD